MKTHDHDNAPSAQRRAAASQQSARRRPVAQQVEPGEAATFVHHVNHSPRMVAQRQLLGAAFGPVAQREPQGLEEELPVQAKALARQQPIQREAGLDDEELPPQAKQAGSGVTLLAGNTAQLTKINKIDVVNEAGYPKWEQNDKTYHITMISVDSMHVTEEYSRNHYHFAVSAGEVTSKRPKKSEVGGRFKDHHTLDEIPDKDVLSFIKNHITAIMNVK